MEEKSLSLSKLILVSLLLYLVWSLWARNWYTSSLRFATAFIFEKNPYNKTIYPQAINSIVIFISLILSVGGLNVYRRIVIILAGLSVLFLTHVSFTHYFTFAINKGIESTPFFHFWGVVVGITAIALPLLLWALLVPESVSSLIPVRGKRYYPCPICGKIKSGILTHIEAVHGKDGKGVRDKRVIEFLHKHPELKNKKFSIE